MYLADNFTSLRNLARERHVSLAIPVFLKGRPNSPREEVVEKEKPVRYIIPPVVSPYQRWHVVQQSLMYLWKSKRKMP